MNNNRKQWPITENNDTNPENNERKIENNDKMENFAENNGRFGKYCWLPNTLEFKNT